MCSVYGHQHTVLLSPHPFTLSTYYRQTGACKQLQPLFQGPSPRVPCQGFCFLGQCPDFSSWAMGGAGRFQMAVLTMSAPPEWVTGACRAASDLLELQVKLTDSQTPPETCWRGLWEQDGPRWGPGSPCRMPSTHHLSFLFQLKFENYSLRGILPGCTSESFRGSLKNTGSQVLPHTN